MLLDFRRVGVPTRRELIRFASGKRVEQTGCDRELEDEDDPGDAYGGRVNVRIAVDQKHARRYLTDDGPSDATDHPPDKAGAVEDT